MNGVLGHDSAFVRQPGIMIIVKQFCAEISLANLSFLVQLLFLTVFLCPIFLKVSSSANLKTVVNLGLKMCKETLSAS